MNPDKLAIGLTVVAAGIGLLGSMVSNYIWWFAISKPEEKKSIVPHILGIAYIIVFLFFLLWGYSIFNSI